MCLFPPFISDKSYRTTDYYGSYHTYRTGYAHLFFNKVSREDRENYDDYDEYREDFVPAHIDSVRLVIQCAIVGLITGALFYTLNSKKAERG